LGHFIIKTMRPSHCGSVAGRLSSVAERLGNVDTAYVRGIGQIGDRAGNAQYTGVATRR